MFIGAKVKEENLADTSGTSPVLKSVGREGYKMKV